MERSAADANDRTVLEQPAVVGARRVTLRLAHRVAKRWERLLDDRDPAHDDATGNDADRNDNGNDDVLHGARVSLRTLRSWLDAHDDLVDVPRKARRRLRSCAHATNEWRDGEVLA